MLPYQPEFPPLAIARAVTELTGRPVIGAPTPIRRGEANENWLVETREGTLLCKVAPTAAPVDKWQAAARAVELAVGAEIPTPALVAAHPCAALSGRFVRILEWVEGEPAGELDAPLSACPMLWSDLGHAVRRMHEVHLPAFSSRLDGSAPSFPTWDAYLAYRIPQIHQRAAASGYFDLDALGRLWAAIGAEARRLDWIIHPTLTHRDLHLGNILVTPDGRLAAIVDFDNAEAWDPVADFFKLRWWVWNECPEIEPLFVAGYGSPPEVHPHFAERLNIVSAVELVNILAQDTVAEDCAVDRGRLQAVTKEAGWPELVRP